MTSPRVNIDRDPTGFHGDLAQQGRSHTESAFPHLDESCQRVNESEHTPGLTKRELAAFMALQGAVASPHLKGPGDCASFALQAADKLLEFMTDEVTR